MGPAHCPLLYSKAWIHSSTVTVSWGKSSVTQFPQTNKSPKFTALLTSVFHLLKCLQNGVNIITFLHMKNLHNEEIMVEWLKCSLPWWFSGKESTYSEGDSGSTPGLGRSPGVGNGNSLQYSCLKSPTEEPGGATVQRVTKSQIWERRSIHAQLKCWVYYYSEGKELPMGAFRLAPGSWIHLFASPPKVLMDSGLRFHPALRVAVS